MTYKEVGRRPSVGRSGFDAIYEIYDNSGNVVHTFICYWDSEPTQTDVDAKLQKVINDLNVPPEPDEQTLSESFKKAMILMKGA